MEYIQEIFPDLIIKDNYIHISYYLKAPYRESIKNFPDLSTEIYESSEINEYYIRLVIYHFKNNIDVLNTIFTKYSNNVYNAYLGYYNTFMFTFWFGTG